MIIYPIVGLCSLNAMSGPNPVKKVCSTTLCDIISLSVDESYAFVFLFCQWDCPKHVNNIGLPSNT